VKAKTLSIPLYAEGFQLIEVHCEITSGPTMFIIEGLSTSLAAKAKIRIRSAINSMGLSLPAKTITVTFSCFDQSRELQNFDLPIAMSLLSAMGVIPKDEAERHICIGGLSPDGAIVRVNGVLSAAIAAAEENCGVVCAKKCGPVAAWIGSVQVITPRTLLELVNHFTGRRVLPTVEHAPNKLEEKYLTKITKVDGKEFLTVCNVICLYMDGLIYPISTKYHEAF